MKIFLSILFFVTNFVYAQNFNQIRDDKTCLNFIKQNFDKDFIFYNSFSSQELSKLKFQIPYKNWGVLDFNHDGKNDLFFIGKHDKTNYYGSEVIFYLSSDTGYRFIFLTKNSYFVGSAGDAFVFFKKISGKNLLFVYYFDKEALVDSTKYPELVKFAKNKYPYGTVKADTFIFKYGSIINYSINPCKLNYDSLICYISQGWGIYMEDI